MSEKCKHENKTFVTFVNHRGYPEKLFTCDDCGIPISDFADESEIQAISTHHSVPVIELSVDQISTEISL